MYALQQGDLPLRILSISSHIRWLIFGIPLNGDCNLSKSSLYSITRSGSCNRLLRDAWSRVAR